MDGDIYVFVCISATRICGQLQTCKLPNLASAIPNIQALQHSCFVITDSEVYVSHWFGGVVAHVHTIPGQESVNILPLLQTQYYPNFLGIKERLAPPKLPLSER